MALTALSAALGLSPLAVELIGYAGSVLVLLSLTMTSAKKLRWLSLCGSTVFAFYSLLIASYPTMAVNCAIVAINAWFLVSMGRHKERLELLPVSLSSRYLRRFTDFYAADIQKYFPRFSMQDSRADTAFFVCRDMVNAGLLLGKSENGGVLRLELDYVTPRFRDFRAGAYLHGQLARLGYRRLVLPDVGQAHRRYLKKAGFVFRQGEYVLELRPN